MSIHQTAERFDPGGPGARGGLWGLPFTAEEAQCVVLPVPWEVTVSYGAGAARGPEAILSASTQVDLYDPRHPDAWKKGIALAALPTDLKRRGEELRPKALAVVDSLSAGTAVDASILDEVNRGCEEMVAHVRRQATEHLDRGKLVSVLGGDHSVPLGLMQALAERGRFGILHIDAHCDLRLAYEGFVHSHASIMRNALELEPIERLVQVGIRDYSQEEVDVVRQSEGRVVLFDYRATTRRRLEGESWSSIVDPMLAPLPESVYVSFDIDGLDPALCPGTGTPVPGGLQIEEAFYLVERLLDSGRRIVGFDLCEVSPGPDPSDEWDANVGARVLYRLCCAALG